LAMSIIEKGNNIRHKGRYVMHSYDARVLRVCKSELATLSGFRQAQFRHPMG
jgi:hypothetical protein